MGIPKFFRWLSRRYPMILQSIQGEREVPPQDNLYLDMNSIVHNAIHGNDPQRMERVSKMDDFEEVWADIMRGIDDIVHMVKPRKLILLALDGVAPRAKMNQQRARRFNKEKESKGSKNFDTNQISPGTDFMHKLGLQLEWFVKYKLNTDPLYQNCERVVLSDTSVPGEGEHKMLDYIRNLKLNPTYDPNTRHCFYGSDADLIMLSLLTHEPHFTIIREEHQRHMPTDAGVFRADIQRSSPLQLIHISILREYFELEYQEIAARMKIKFDIERIIDDFVFFCFFIGNDFLPSLSALDIGEGSLDQLIDFYKECLPKMEDYITEQGQIFWDRAQPFLSLLADYESKTFINRNKTLNYSNETKDKKRAVCTKLKQDGKSKELKRKWLLENTKNVGTEVSEKILQRYKNKRVEKCPDQAAEIEKESLQDMLGKIDDDLLSELSPGEIPVSYIVEPPQELTENEGPKEPETPEEKNLMFMLSFSYLYEKDPEAAKQKYYSEKLKFDTKGEDGRIELQKMLYRYLEGLQWVMHYYYSGAKHWRWFYPYHYAPMISDMGNVMQKLLGNKATISEFKVDTNCSSNPEPYTPFQQLLCILPIKSLENCLPIEYSQLAKGTLKEYFPDTFEIDLNGKSVSWQAEILIPFANESTFLEAEKSLYQNGFKLNEHLTQRNTITFDYPSFFHNKSSQTGELKSTLKRMKALKHDFTGVEIHKDYGDVGKTPFPTKLLKGVVTPQPDMPSLKWIKCKNLKWVEKRKFENEFKVAQVVLDNQLPQDLDKYLKPFEIFENESVFVDFPYQYEAIAVKYETRDFVYDIQEKDDGSGYHIVKSKQTCTKEEYNQLIKGIKDHFEQSGIFCTNYDVLCSVKWLVRTQLDKYGKVEKIFNQRPEMYPLQVVMTNRDSSHYLNLQNNKELGGICLSPKLFGIMTDKNLKIDKEREQKQFHNPTESAGFLQRQIQIHKDVLLKKQKFYEAYEIDKILEVEQGTVNQLVGSYMVMFFVGHNQKQAYNCGLNIKNFPERVHIPDHVKFCVPKESKYTIYDEEQKLSDNKKYFVYSKTVLEVLKEYKHKYPEIITACEAVVFQRNKKKKPVKQGLKDIFPKLSKDGAMAKLQEIIKWLKELPMSNLPFVELGFESIPQNLMQDLSKYQQQVQNKFTQFGIDDSDKLSKNKVFQEKWPFWSSPYTKNTFLNDFKIGDRVINVNSMERNYVPFGHRGTVVGKTDIKITVMFDEQFFGGDSIHNLCEDYRGALVYPKNLINVTQSFATMAEQGEEVLQTEIDLTTSHQAISKYVMASITAAIVWSIFSHQ